MENTTITISSSSEVFPGFKLLNQCLACNTIRIKKYQSSRTDLLVITADVPGPLVHGTFFVATEAMDDDGLPHTLEHLIFLGSSDFPYKGSLDIIANRCLASGTNAWTDTDHTAYTVSTAGFDGFLTLLPIYLDHLFFPTLTDSGFITEVYHMTEEAKDSGVVFCEMQGRESDSDCLTQIELMRALYPRSCGYRYETGGIVGNLRYSTSIEKVRRFHEQFYCPKNTALIIAGVLDEEKLFDVIRKFEEKIIKNGCKNFEKAWQTPVPLMTKRNIRAITYPSDQEDNGTVVIGWQGPSSVNEYYHLVASEMLCQYLTETAASPLMKHFVENEAPFCSSISGVLMPHSLSVISITFENVVIKKMECIVDELMNVLKLIVDNVDDKYKFSETRMKSVIERSVLKQLLSIEAAPQNEIAFSLIGDILYGKTPDAMCHRLNRKALSEKLLAEPVTFWLGLLKTYFIEKPYALVLGYPSKTEHKIRSIMEDERIENRKATLKEDGLGKKKEILEKANEDNQKLPPDELIASISVPSISNFNFIPIRRYSSVTEIQYTNFNVQSTPVFTQLDDLKSQFVYVYVIMNGSKLPCSLRLYLPLFLEYLLACPVERNGKIFSFEKIVEELEQDIVTVSSNVGLTENSRFSCGQFYSAVSVQMKVIPENFEKSMNWIRELLYQSVFTVDRLKVVAQKLISSISQIRRQGRAIVKHLTKIMLFHPNTNHSVCSVLQQLRFLTELLEKLQDADKSSQIIQDLLLLRAELTNPANIILHISADLQNLVSKFKNPSDCISKIIPENEIPNRTRYSLPQDHEYLSPFIGNPVKSCVVGMATADSSFLCHSILSIKDHYHPDLPAVLVFIQFLTQLEGPMWRDIRGFGLAYHYSVVLYPEEGVMCLVLMRATDVVQAFRRSINIFNEFIKTAGEWNILHFETAKSSLIYDIVSDEKDISSASLCSMLSYFKGTSEDYNKSFIEKINNVQLEDMKRVTQYMLPVLDPKSSYTVVVCHSSKVESVAHSFAEVGFTLEQYSSLEESFLNPDVMKSLCGK